MKVWISLCALMSLCSRLSTADDLKLPSYVDVCYRDDPKVGECLKNTIMKLLPIFRQGSEEFDLEPLDPLFFPNLKFTYSSGIIGGEFTLHDTIIKNLTRVRITDIKPNINELKKKFILDFDVELDAMGVETPYKMAGNILTAPIKLEGFVDVRFGTLNLTYHLDGDVKTIGDYDYLILNKFLWRFKGEGINTAFMANDNVVTGQPTLSRFVRTLFKSSWKLLKDPVLHAVLPTTDKTLTETFVKFFKKYPYDILFPKKDKSKTGKSKKH